MWKTQPNMFYCNVFNLRRVEKYCMHSCTCDCHMMMMSCIGHALVVLLIEIDEPMNKQQLTQQTKFCYQQRLPLCDDLSSAFLCALCSIKLTPLLLYLCLSMLASYHAALCSALFALLLALPIAKIIMIAKTIKQRMCWCLIIL